MKGGILKRRNGQYYVWYPNGHSGKYWIREYFDHSKIFDERQAQRVLERVRSDVDKAGKFEPGNYGLDKSILIENAWETYQAGRNVTLETLTWSDRQFNSLILPFFDGKTVREVRKIDLANWLTWLREKNLGDTYLRKLRAVLHAFLKSTCDYEGQMPMFPSVSVKQKEKPWLTKEQQGQVLEFIPERHRPIISLICHFGLRISEACRLERKDIFLEERKFIIRNRKAGDENALPIDEYTEAIFRAPQNVTSFRYAFVSPLGNPYSRATLYQIWNKANKEANQKHGTPLISLQNGSRHSFVSQAINAGESYDNVRKITKNTIQVLQKNYENINLEAKKEVMERR